MAVQIRTGQTEGFFRQICEVNSQGPDVGRIKMSHPGVFLKVTRHGTSKNNLTLEVFVSALSVYFCQITYD